MKKTAVCLLALILMMLGWIIYANDYQFVAEPIALNAGGNRLTGTLVLPKETVDKPGVIVLIHGDGPANADRDEGYYSLWETLAEQGYAVLAFDKAGVGGSSGNWLHQTMSDRAKETVDIIDWARKDGRFNSQCIGLWGPARRDGSCRVLPLNGRISPSRWQWRRRLTGFVKGTITPGRK